jgi:uncharacterized protein YjbI with pentapeptide repeats
MANPEYFNKLLKEGVTVWNQWRKEHPNIQPDLREAHLSCAPLQGAYLEGALLQGADLTKAQLQGAYLGGALLQGADLTEALLQGADLRKAQLQGANLSYAQMRGVDLREALLQEADLSYARLQYADLREAQLEKANLEEAHLEEAHLERALLKEAIFSSAHLEEAHLEGAQLQGARLSNAQMKKARLEGAQLEKADLGGTLLKEAHLEGAQLQGANLEGARLEKAHLERAQLERANLREAQLQGAILRTAQLESTILDKVTLDDKHGIGPQLADIGWGSTNLTVVDWSGVKRLGDEEQARQKTRSDRTPKDLPTRLKEYETAVRANRQLTTVLRDQGLNEQADRFAYQAQLCTQHLLLLHTLQYLADLPKLRWLAAEPSPPTEVSYWLRWLLPFLGCISLFWGLLMLEPAVLPMDFLREVVLFPLLVGLFLALVLLVFYQPRVRLVLASLLLPLLLPVLFLGLLVLIFFFLLTILLHPSWLFLMLSGSLFLIWLALRRLPRQFPAAFATYLKLLAIFGQYLFSRFLDLLAGYGYRPERAFFWYLTIIFGFAAAYHLLGGLSLFPPDAFVYSLTSFHGRGFFPGLGNEASLHNPLVMLAAIEAVVGLFIEISFIATFTQRFFAK